MKGKMLTATAYPPPPPPLPSSPKKDSRKLIVIALLLVIIIVSAGVLVYLATRPSSTSNPTPTPTGTATPTPTGTGATPTPTGTSPTATPSGTNPAANWRAGSWAQYAIKTYGTGGEVAAESTMKYSMDEGTYSGTACWLMTYETQSQQDSVTTRTVMTYWMSKSTLEGIHVKTQMYSGNDLIYEHEDDITPGETGDIPEPIDMTTVTSYETVTVPAGTFNCGKITVTTTISGTTVVSSSWANSNIPIMGLVKIEQTSGGVRTQTTELTDYHS